MTIERLSYRFGPLERRGLLGPLRFGQVATIGGALAVGVELLDRVGGGGGVMAAIALLAGAVGLATAPVAGRTIEEWAPVGCAFALRSAGSHRRFRSRLPNQGVGRGRLVGPGSSCQRACGASSWSASSTAVAQSARYRSGAAGC